MTILRLFQKEIQPENLDDQEKHNDNVQIVNQPSDNPANTEAYIKTLVGVARNMKPTDPLNFKVR